MAISLKHLLQSAKSDGADNTLVQPSDWNAEHVLQQATATILGRVTAGTGNTEELTAAQVRTLINVEDGADVTDAVNIASSIVGVAGKTTPVDADTIPLIDSAASNALKELTWANLKTAALTNPVITGSAVEDTYTITDGAGFAIDPTNGSIQQITLGAARTPTQANWTAGQSIILKIADGTAYTINWGTINVVWVGGSAPTLATTGWTWVALWKQGTTVYGNHLGDTA